MKLLKLWEKIGKQPVKIVRHQEAIVFIRNHNTKQDEEYLITGIRYESGKPLGFNTVPINCKTCKYKGGGIPHTCDICDSLDTDDFYMWSYNKDYEK